MQGHNLFVRVQVTFQNTLSSIRLMQYALSGVTHEVISNFIQGEWWCVLSKWCFVWSVLYRACWRQLSECLLDKKLLVVWQKKSSGTGFLGCQMNWTKKKKKISVLVLSHAVIMLVFPENCLLLTSGWERMLSNLASLGLRGSSEPQWDLSISGATLDEPFVVPGLQILVLHYKPLVVCFISSRTYGLLSNTVNSVISSRCFVAWIIHVKGSIQNTLLMCQLYV